jgi:hypothetical protein
VPLVNDGPLGEDGKIQQLLTRQQRAVHDVLAVRGPRYGQIYMGAVMVLGEHGNPDRYALVAHGLREVAELMQRDFGASVRVAGESMRAKANELEDVYARAERQLADALVAITPVMIDRPVLLVIQRLVQFVEWNREFAPRRRIRATRAVQTMAVTGGVPTPEHAQSHVRELLRCHDRLNEIAHHDATSETEMLALVDSFERLLLEMLGGQSNQLQEIDELLKGGAGGAE